MNLEHKKSELAQALRQGGWIAESDWVVAGAVQRLIDTIGVAEGALTLDEVRKATAALNAHLNYRATRDLINAWRARHKPFDAVLGKHYAQALINSGGLEDAEEFIVGALYRVSQLPASREKTAETAELHGLFARVAKDRFVRAYETRAPEDAENVTALLEIALQRYADAYNSDPSRYWQRINAIALRVRLARERSETVPAEALDGARDIIARLQPACADEAAANADPYAPWAIATLSEAYLALGDRCADAQAWLGRLIRHPHVTAFQLASYARQLREIWLGDALKAGPDCASLLAATLLRHQLDTTGSITVSAEQVNEHSDAGEGLERIFSGHIGINGVKVAMACQAIGCICTATGMRFGTGFLVRRREVWPDRTEQPDDLVFVTNAHVISPDYPSALRPHEASVSFNMEAIATQSPDKRYRIRNVLFTSKPGDIGVRLNAYKRLDITIVELDEAPLCRHGLTLQFGGVAKGRPAFVIGHPGGRDLHIATEDSAVIDVDHLPRLFHYRTATEPGSSGSPVFNDAWEVIGIHHAGRQKAPMLSGSGTHDANEGVALRALRQRLDGVFPPPASAPPPSGSGAPAVP